MNSEFPTDAEILADPISSNTTVFLAVISLKDSPLIHFWASTKDAIYEQMNNYKFDEIPDSLIIPVETFIGSSTWKIAHLKN